MNSPKPPPLPFVSPRTGNLVCYQCRAGYASEADNLCGKCRSKGKKRFISGWEARQAKERELF